jgi:hypothetical protein
MGQRHAPAALYLRERPGTHYKTYIKHLNSKLYYQQLHLKYCVTWQGIDYKLPEDDTIGSTHVAV